MEDRVIAHGGSRPKPPGELRNPLLRRHGAAVAEASLARIYETWPEFRERYGERGRQLTAEDNHWHLNFLDAALALGDPSHFHRYAEWLVRFLGPRGLTHEHIAGAFGFLADGLDGADCPSDLEAHRRLMVDLLREAAWRVLANRVPPATGPAPAPAPSA